MKKIPTHKHIETGSLVFPEGYSASELELLPNDYWQKTDAEAALIELRFKRDKFLEDSDKMMLSDRGFNQAEVISYRQALRDITQGNLTKPNWPIKPKEQIK